MGRHVEGDSQFNLLFLGILVFTRPYRSYR